MKTVFICYPKCSTCRKAAAWLKEKNIEVDFRDISTENPSKEELAEWWRKSGLPLRKFFNTSGLKYKTLNLKEVLKTADEKQMLDLLASDGMLVKRPLLLTDDKVWIGFREEEWAENL